jgi:hypothetical protein
MKENLAMTKFELELLVNNDAVPTCKKVDNMRVLGLIRSLQVREL